MTNIEIKRHQGIIPISDKENDVFNIDVIRSTESGILSFVASSYRVVLNEEPYRGTPITGNPMYYCSDLLEYFVRHGVMPELTEAPDHAYAKQLSDAIWDIPSDKILNALYRGLVDEKVKIIRGASQITDPSRIEELKAYMNTSDYRPITYDELEKLLKPKPDTKDADVNTTKL